MKRAAIQWEDVHRRLKTNEEALEKTLAESPERIKTVFRQRAVQLAKEHAGNKNASKGLPALIFRLARERYAVALQELSEVLPFRDCRPVPGTSPEFLGVINLRGELRPVIDLARVLSGSASIETGAVLVLRRQAALKVDAVEGLREIGPEELASPIQGRYIQAFASGTLGLLDVETMLAAVFLPKESRAL